MSTNVLWGDTMTQPADVFSAKVCHICKHEFNCFNNGKGKPTIYFCCSSIRCRDLHKKFLAKLNYEQRVAAQNAKNEARKARLKVTPILTCPKCRSTNPTHQCPVP